MYTEQDAHGGRSGVIVNDEGYLVHDRSFSGTSIYSESSSIRVDSQICILIDVEKSSPTIIEPDSQAQSEGAFEAIQTADTLLNDLAQISIVIRRATVNSHVAKADSTFQPKRLHLPILQEYLTNVVLFRPGTLDSWRHTNRKVHDLGSVDVVSLNAFSPFNVLTSVQKRLVAANLRRNHRFTYAQRHELKRKQTQSAAGVEIASEIMYRTAIASQGQIAPSMTEKLISIKPGRKQAKEAAAAVLSNTTASVLDSELLQRPALSIVTSQQSGTEHSAIASQIRSQYPRPPNPNQRQLDLKCPCCCVTLPKKTFQGHRWRFVGDTPRPALTLWDSNRKVSGNMLTKISSHTPAFLTLVQTPTRSTQIEEAGFVT